jgi:hypothetical protein
VSTPKKDKKIVQFRMLYNEKMLGLCRLTSIIPIAKYMKKRQAEHVARMGKQNTYTKIVGELLSKHEVGKTRKREDNIKTGPCEVVCEKGRWIDTFQDHVQWWTMVLFV